MSDTSAKAAMTAEPKTRRDFSIIRLILEGRAFFALIAIIIVFSLLSPNYFTVFLGALSRLNVGRKVFRGRQQ